MKSNNMTAYIATRKRKLGYGVITPLYVIMAMFAETREQHTNRYTTGKYYSKVNLLKMRNSR